MSLRLIQSHDEPTYAVHRNQFAARSSGLHIGYFDDRAWYEKRRYRWTAIAIAVVALIGLYLLRSSVASY